MKSEEMNTLIDTVKEKLGEDKSALIVDDLATLINDNNTNNMTIDKLTTDNNNLVADKEKLQTANMNLLTQIPVIEDKKQNKQEPEEKKKIKVSDFIDTKTGKFL